MRNKNEEIMLHVGYLMKEFKDRYLMQEQFIEFEVTINTKAKDCVNIKIVDVDKPERFMGDVLYKTDIGKKCKNLKNRKFRYVI